MEELLDLLCDLHVVVKVVAANVSRGNNSISGQLPDMELVYSQHTVDLLE